MSKTVLFDRQVDRRGVIGPFDIGGYNHVAVQLTDLTSANFAVWFRLSETGEVAQEVYLNNGVDPVDASQGGTQGMFTIPMTVCMAARFLSLAVNETGVPSGAIRVTVVGSTR